MREDQQLVYEGKAKKLYKIGEENVFLVEYLDQVTALNGVKKEKMTGKATLNNEITALIFHYLTEKGIENHFIKKISKTEQLVREVTMFSLEVVVRNVAAGSFSKRLGVAEGTELAFPVIEFYYKNDALDDPLINEDHVQILNLASKEEMQIFKEKALKINQVLKELFAEIHISLVDYKIEFGALPDGEILLADEVSPDTCRLWDQQTQASLDKDLYRKEIGDIRPVYNEVLTRLQTKIS
jgi:phosphoribosylaminoimidazole-succinocarboxamide synthase